MLNVNSLVDELDCAKIRGQSTERFREEKRVRTGVDEHEQWQQVQVNLPPQLSVGLFVNDIV